MAVQSRPSAVTVIGRVWIGLGLWMASAGAMGLAVVALQQSEPFFSPPFEWVFPAGLAFQLVVGAAAIVVAIFLLRLARWAYIGLQLVMCMVISYAVAIGMVMMVLAYSGFRAGQATMAMPIIGVGAWMVVAVSVPLALMFRALWCPDVRAAFDAPV